MIENTVTGTHCRSTFGSLTEFAQYAETFAGQYGSAVWSDYMSDWFFGTDDPRSEYQRLSRWLLRDGISILSVA